MNNKRLYRSIDDRIIAGVCGGLGDYLQIDPVLVRLAFILMAFFNGFGILLYIILALVLQNEPGERIAGEADREDKIREFAHEAGERVQAVASEIRDGFKASKEAPREQSAPQEPAAKTQSTVRYIYPESRDWWMERRNIFGLAIILIGIFLLLDQYFPMHWLNARVIGSIVVIAIGAYILLKDKK